MAFNVLYAKQLIVAQSMGSSITSNAIPIQLLDNIGIQFNWTGTPTGDFTVEVSNDHTQDAQGAVINAGNWVELPLSPAIAAAGSADQAFVDINQSGAMFLRVVYTRTSGTGTLSVFVSGKGV